MRMCDRCKQQERGDNPDKAKAIQTVDFPLGTNGWQTDPIDLCLVCNNHLMDTLRAFVIQFVNPPVPERKRSYE